MKVILGGNSQKINQSVSCLNFSDSWENLPLFYTLPFSLPTFLLHSFVMALFTQHFSVQHGCDGSVKQYHDLVLQKTAGWVCGCAWPEEQNHHSEVGPIGGEGLVPFFGCLISQGSQGGNVRHNQDEETAWSYHSAVDNSDAHGAGASTGQL